MDHHHHYHHRDPPHHHHPPHHHPPLPPPPPPPFCHDGPYNSFLPPPPPPPQPSPSFPPSHPPYLSHQPPPFSLSSNRHHEAGFVSSPSHRYPPPLNYDSSHPPPPPPPPPPPHHRRDIGDDFAFVDRRRFDFREPLPPPPPIRVPPRAVSPIVDRQVNFNGYLSPPLPPPPPFVDRFSRDFRSPMIAEEFHVDSRLRLRRFDDDRVNVIDMNELPRPRVCVDDERRNVNVVERDDFRRGRNYDDWSGVNVFDREEMIGGRNEQWRSTDFVERGELCGDGMYEDWRSFKDVEREELLHRRLDERRRIMDGIVRDQLIRYQTLVENDGMVCDRISHDRGIVNDVVLHDVYHPEVSFRDRELSSGGNEFVRGEVVDEVPPIRDENVGLNNFRHGCDDVRGDDVSHSPIKFRGREIEEGELIPEFYEAEMKHGLYAGRRKRERVRGDMHEWNNDSPNSPRKKSAFLRLQPAIQHTGTIRNRLGNNTPSPRKGKRTKVESLDHRSNGNRAGGSVDLDVSFKSNSLVAKAIVATPSSSKGDGDETISESPLRARRFRNGGKNSPVPKREGKQSEDKASVSPILHRVGIRKIAEVRDNSSDLSSSRCSSLSGGGSTCSKSSLEGEVLSKDDKGADFSKESSPSIRRKRKALTFVSRLSASVPTKEIGTDVAYPACRPSSGFVSDDTPVVHSEASFSTCNVIRSSQDHKSDNEKMSVSDCSTTLLQEEDVVHPISEKFLQNKVQTERLQCLSDAPGPLEPRCEQDEPGISNSDDVVALSVGKRSSDINGKKGDDQVQRSALVLVGNGSVEGSSERIALSIGDNMVNNDISFGRTNTCDSLAATNSTTCQVDSSILTENRIDLASSVVNIYDPQGFSLESGIIGQQFGDVHMDGAVSSHLGVGMKSESSPSIDVSSDDTVSIDCVKVTTISDIAITNDLQEQENLANDKARERREGFLESCVSMDGDVGHVALPSVQEDIFPPDKKKAENEPDILDPGTSESFRDTTMSRSMPYRDATLSADRYNLVASSSPCCISESDVSYENGSIRTCVEAKLVMGHVCDLDPEDYRCSCRKRRKTSFLDLNFSGTSTSESADLRESANALKSIAVGPMYCVNSRAQAAGGFSSTLLSPEDVVEATNNQQTLRIALGDSSEVEVLHKDSHSSVEEFAHVSAKQSSYRAQSGCNRTDDSHLMGAGNCLETELIGSDSESVVGKNDWNSCEDCIQPYLAADLNDQSQVAVMECESKIAGKGNLASVSDRPIICTESTQEIVPSQPAVLGSPLNVGSLGVCCQVSSPSDISIPATHANSYNKFSGNVKKTQYLKPLGPPTSQSTFGCRGIQMNMKPDISPAARNQQVAQKTASVPSKPAKKGVAISSTMSRQFCWKNELTHGKKTPSPQVPTVSTFSSRSLATIPAKPRTWNRTNNLAASSSDVRKPSLSMPPPQKPPYRNFLKVRDTSYIRKGNSLVRNSASSTATPSPHVFTRSVIQGKPVDINKTGKLKSCGTINSTGSPDCLIKGGQHTTIDMPKLSHLPYREKTPDSNIASPGELTSSLEINQSEGMDISAKVKATETALDPSRNPHNVPDKSLEDPGTLSDGVLQASNTKTVIYIKRKSNQLIAASTPHLSSREKSGLIMGNKVASSSDTSYYKRRKNQLVRASSESNIMKMVGAAADNFDSSPPKALTAHLGRSPTKRLFRRVKSLKASLVWKLGDPKSPDKAPEPLRSKQLLSHLLPWKRATYWRSVWRASASISNCSSSMKTRKLASSRNQAVLYVRSGRGFSLRRSKVISLAGSLKWSKSMEKRAKKVDEDAALAVAASDSARRQKSGVSDVSSESGIGNFSSHKSVHSLKVRSGERIFRVGVFRYRMDPSRRTLQRIPDEEERDSTIPKTGKFARKTYVPKRLLIGSNEYVRIGNGNQLVRDPKRRTRILASEKVRWSLHTARMRLAKKRRFCQFFTRFGRCNKSEGKCPYVHDASKIAVCTKFLKGLCADLNCKLTHKVIPERMPDCSFFLQGLCSNESCPYRHVNANPKASICESFLRGYCAEGNECQKKHSYLCPEFEATGSCPQGSKCKLYHPKKSTCQKGKILDDQRYIRGRYFDTGLMAAAEESERETAIHEQEVVPKKNIVISEGGDCGDYISLDVSDDEAGESRCLNTEVMYLCEFDALTSPPSDDVDELAKPLCILDTH